MNRPEPTLALIFIAALLAMHEFFAMTLPKEDRGPSLIIGALACLVFYFVDPFVSAYYHLSPRLALITELGAKPFLLVVVVLLPGLYYLFRFGEIPTVAGRITATITGIVYAGLLAMFLACFKRSFPMREGG